MLRIGNFFVLPAAVCALAAFGLGASAAAVAESEESESTDSMIEEIIVTATHRETGLMDTAVSISAVDGDTIDQLGATDILTCTGRCRVSTRLAGRPATIAW